MSQLEYDRAEALRYFGTQAGDEQAGAVADLAYQRLRDELQPRYTSRRMSCSVQKDEVRLATGVIFHSRLLAEHLRACREIFLFGATLGIKVDIALRRIGLKETAGAAAGQAVAAALIESYCDQCCRELEQQLPAGLRLLTRFSPGYGDWPLQEQKLLCRLLDSSNTIGLTLTEGCMMVPIKSVTAVIGIVPAEKGWRSVYAGNSQHECQDCGKTDCKFRRCDHEF